MLTLINAPLTPIYQRMPDITSPTRIKFDDRMTTRHTCPCCSSVLLRHVSCSRVYWHCSRCRAPMSVWQQFE